MKKVLLEFRNLAFKSTGDFFKSILVYVLYLPVFLGAINIELPKATVKFKNLLTVLSWIGVGFIILIVFVLRVFYHLLSKKSEETTRETNPHEALVDFDSEIYGVKYINVEVYPKLSMDGSCKTKCHNEVIAITHKVYATEHYITCPHSPENAERCMDLVNKEREVGDGIKMIPEIITQTKQTLFWRLNFQPALIPGHQPIKYHYEDFSPPKAFAMTLSELSARDMQCEYFAKLVTYPTSCLLLRVTFPADFTPTDIDYDVWLGLARSRHEMEFSRIHTKSLFSDGRDGEEFYIQLKIQNPVRGLNYVLKWKPWK